mmetsp:Transcript_4931/g.7300  ORF Transcript_4931/g.7300 Transcript_4931/m.7300 type:complete len:97 (+) Transcript_4931:168-458(+)
MWPFIERHPVGPRCNFRCRSLRSGTPGALIQRSRFPRADVVLLQHIRFQGAMGLILACTGHFFIQVVFEKKQFPAPPDSHHGRNQRSKDSHCSANS